MRSGNMRFFGGVGVILVLFALGYWVWLGSGDDSAIEVTRVAPPQAEAAPAEGRGRVAAVQGGVEILSGRGEWQAANVGDTVDPGAGFRTDTSGMADLAYGEVVVSVTSDTDVRVVSADDDVLKLRVERGRLVTRATDANERLIQVTAANSDAVAEIRNGEMFLQTDGDGSVQTAVTKGRGTLTAQGKTVDLEEGTQSIVEKGRAPTRPTKIPSSMLLKVSWPEAGVTAKARHRVVGRANPGAHLLIGDQRVTADSRGQFTAIITLREGENTIPIRALDVVGRTKKLSSPPIELDTKAPAHAVETNPNMWRQRPNPK